MQEREAQRQPLVRATPSPIRAKNPLSHHRPLAPIPVRFAPFFLPLLTIPACSAAPSAGAQAAPDPAPAQERESGRACTFLSRPISHAISSLLYARRPASHACAPLDISAYPPIPPFSQLKCPLPNAHNADPAALRAKYMAEFAPFLLSPQMMQKIEEAQQNYANETLQAVNAQHAQVCVCVILPACVCVNIPSPSIKYIILPACVCVNIPSPSIKYIILPACVCV